MDPARFGKLARIFGEARDLDSEPRIEYVESECGGDEELRELVETMLRVDSEESSKYGSRCSIRITTSVPGLEDFAGTPGHEDPAPEQIGKYRTLGLLGHGGQSTVYRGLHPTLEHEVVIKLAVDPIPEGSAFRDRIVAEGKILAELDSPGLARVHDLDFHEGRPYLVLDFIRGRTLLRVARDEPLTPREAASIVARVALALGPAHRRGIVHRDIKPNNIILDEARQPHLIDFGVAMVEHPSSGASLSDDSISGTAEFMAPEQARANSGPVGPRSDIFSLGAVLYFLLTGRPPFSGDTLAERLARAGRCDFDRDATTRQGIPGDIATACRKAMEADPADRFATVEDLATALETQLAPEPVGGRSRPRIRLATLMALLTIVIAILFTILFATSLGRGFRVESIGFHRVLPDGAEAPLHDGDTVSVGDSFVLHFRADRDVWLYVLTEDERGHRDLLFPSLDPRVPLRNPVSGRTAHSLPGPTPWQVRTPGGREHFLIAVSGEPIAELESVPVNQVLAPSRVLPLLRACGLPEEDDREVRTGRRRLGDFIRMLESDPSTARTTEGVWIRRVSLLNP